MIVPIIGCIIAGCLQDIPVVVGNGGWHPDIDIREQFKRDPSPVACYIEGVFHETCPTPKWKEKPLIKGKPWQR